MSDESTIRILRDKIEVRDRALLKCAREYEGGYLAGAQRLVMDWIYKAQDSMMADREKIALKPTENMPVEKIGSKGRIINLVRPFFYTLISIIIVGPLWHHV